MCATNEIIYSVNPAGVANFPREFRRTWHEEDFNLLYHARMYVIGKDQFREKLFLWGIESINPKEGVSYAGAIVDYFVSQLPAEVRSRYDKPAKSLDDMIDLLKEVLEPEAFVSDISVCHWLQARLPIDSAFGKGAFEINSVVYFTQDITVAGWLALIVCAMFKEAGLHLEETNWIHIGATQKL